MAILVIEHPHGGGPGNFARVAHVMERELISVRLDREELPGAEQFDSLVIMGGLENVDQQQRYPYLTEEIDYIRDWIASGKPLLGVCLGAQLLSLASGGQVERMAASEIGWHSFAHVGAPFDPVLTRVEDQVALQWHAYTVVPPPAATVLARNDYGVQAFRYRQAWGVQFHPEGNQETIRRWVEELGRNGEQEKINEIQEGARLYGPAWRRYGSELFGRFLALT